MTTRPRPDAVRPRPKILASLASRAPLNIRVLRNCYSGVSYVEGVVILLKYPYPREVSEPVQYDCIKVHAQTGEVTTDSDRLRHSVRTLNFFVILYHVCISSCCTELCIILFINVNI